MAAMLEELLPWLNMRYLGEISYIEDRALREQRAWAFPCFPKESESNLCSTLCFPGRRP